MKTKQEIETELGSVKMYIVKTKGKFQIWHRKSRWEIVSVSGLFKTRESAEKRLAEIERGKA